MVLLNEYKERKKEQKKKEKKKERIKKERRFLTNVSNYLKRDSTMKKTEMSISI